MSHLTFSYTHGSTNVIELNLVANIKIYVSDLFPSGLLAVVPWEERTEILTFVVFLTFFNARPPSGQPGPSPF